MSLEVWTEVKADHVRLHCRGTFSLQEALETYEMAYEMAAARGLNAVLVDATELERPVPTTLERYVMGVQLAKLQAEISPRVLIAMAIAGREPMIDPQRFGEKVARNRGAIAGVFTDVNEAMGWLKKGATEEPVPQLPTHRAE